jgi:hypothetical protein
MQVTILGFVLCLMAVAVFLGYLRAIGVKQLRCPILHVEFKPQIGRAAPKRKEKGKDGSG